MEGYSVKERRKTWGRTWEIGQPINSTTGSGTADGVARQTKACGLVREPDAGNLHDRFDERNVETETCLIHAHMRAAARPASHDAAGTLARYCSRFSQRVAHACTKMVGS